MLDHFDPRLDADFPALTAQRLSAALRAVLPAEAILTDVEALRPYESDGLAAYRSLPGAVVMPTTVAQVADVMRTCRDLSVPVVARGAGTGLSGGALPFPGCVLLSMAKFSTILEIDADARIARVQPGVRNLAISEAVAPHGLYYAPIRPRRSPAPSAATWRRIPAACIA